MPVVKRRSHVRNGKRVRAHTVKVRAASQGNRAAAPRRAPREAVQNAMEVGLFSLLGTVAGWTVRAALGVTLALVVGITVAGVGLAVWLITDKRRRRRRSWWSKRRARKRRIRRARVANLKQGARNAATGTIGRLVRWRK